MKKRIISSIMLASMMLSMAACGNGGTNDGKDTTDTTIAEEDILPAGIEKQNYGETVNIAMIDWGLYKNYFAANDDMTDVMNKALYNRELKVEEYLGVDITYEVIGTHTDMLPAISSAVSTGDDLYQIALNHCIRPNITLITNGYVADMNEMDIDFTGEWFNQKSNEALEVQGKQFFAISDYMLPDPNVILFNKEIIGNNNMEDPYQLVRDGKWTIDKMAEMSHLATMDNGDTVWDHKDTYGFATLGDWYFGSFLFSADVPFMEKNTDGEFELLIDNERAYALMEKMDALINSPDTYIYTSVDAEDAITIDSGRTLFTMFALNNLYTVREAETEFGILPYPKLDEEQEDYISNDWSGLMCVPMSVKEEKYKMVGDVIELLAYHSEEEVIPAYIDTTLGLKLARDPESKEMIELVFDSVLFNAGMNYFGLGENGSNGVQEIFFAIHQMLVMKGENTFASWLATYTPKAEQTINDFNEAVKALAD